jgi:hypothetical protein
MAKSLSLFRKVHLYSSAPMLFTDGLTSTAPTRLCFDRKDGTSRYCCVRVQLALSGHTFPLEPARAFALAVSRS